MDENIVESSSVQDENEQEQETESAATVIDSEQEEVQELEGKQEQEESEEETQEIVFLSDPAVSETVVMLRDDVSLLVQSVEKIQFQLGAVTFLILFVWVEKKIKNAVIKMSGGKKNAGID